jgi:2-amino-4-hydroxy-6-hydroxymethyldihydropteridine diphosphokinase
MRKRTRRNSRRRRKSGPTAATKRSTDPDSHACVAYLGLGSNVGNRRAHLGKALEELARLAPVERVSSFYGSDPVGYARQRRFWNAVAQIRWTRSPEALLLAAKRIERHGGRTPTFAGGPREIDVDILDLGGLVRETPDPVLPHPRLAERRFALAPLAEISPEWRHPVTGLTAAQMLAKLPRTPAARRIQNPKSKVLDLLPP